MTKAHMKCRLIPPLLVFPLALNAHAVNDGNNNPCSSPFHQNKQTITPTEKVPDRKEILEKVESVASSKKVSTPMVFSKRHHLRKPIAILQEVEPNEKTRGLSQDETPYMGLSEKASIGAHIGIGIWIIAQTIQISLEMDQKKIYTALASILTCAVIYSAFPIKKLDD